tara:strand:- start:57543 stop:57722 length:180 start_codon:yes stop_codon:yes gene_type:complete
VEKKAQKWKKAPFCVIQGREALVKCEDMLILEPKLKTKTNGVARPQGLQPPQKRDRVQP